MTTIDDIRRATRVAAGITLAWLLSTSPGMTQSARVASGSLKISSDPVKKSLIVGFRLVDAMNVTSVTASAEGATEPLPATWEAWEGAKAPACAWMVVVDISNPARAKTIDAGKEAVRSFLTGLPKGDAVAIYGLARDLEQVVPFGSHPEDALTAITPIKAQGDASQTTLIYQNLREGLAKLAAREEPRKAVLLLTDGKDETPGEAAAQEIEKNKLIEAAKAAGVAIHCLGYAESLGDQSYFGALKEISNATDGLFFPASVGGKELPKGAIALLRGVMRGTGAAHVDLSKLEKPAEITLKAVAAVSTRTEGGAEVVIKVPAEEVAKALPAPAASSEDKDPVAADAEKKKAEEEAKAKAKADEEAAAAAAKAKEEEAKAVARKAAEEKKAAEAKKRQWIIIGAAILLAILVAALLMVRASRMRAAEEQARIAAEAERAAQEARIAEETRRAAEETKKAEAKPLAWLEMCDAQQTRHAIRIPSLKIGRGQHNDFVLRNDSVSGNHCVLNRSREGEWTVTDLNSGNGVVLNGTQVQQAALRHGDTIELGELKMRFLLHA